MRLPPDDASIARAADALVRGDLVAFPTETVYGLGARADQSDAVRRIYAKKGRPAHNPSIVHCLTVEGAFALAADVPARARALAEAWWPGPLTLILPVRPGAVAEEVTAGGPTVAVRVPAHPVARALLAACRLPIAAPSANRSTRISPTTAEHVEKSLGADVLVIDGGATGFGIESTIVDVTREPFVVLRRGSVTLAELSRFADVVDKGDIVANEGEVHRAPGTASRHYAPRVPLVVARREELVAAAREGAERAGAAPSDVGLLVLEPAPAGLDGGSRTIALPRDPERYASALYASLHRLEDGGAVMIVVEEVPGDESWAAIRDRLTRAAR